MLAVSTSNMLVFVSLLCMVVGNPVSDETENRDARQILFRYRVPWSAPASFFNDDNSDDYQDDNNEENLINLLSSDAIKWMKNLNQDERERLTSWTLASAVVAKLTKEKRPDSGPFDRSGSYLYNGAFIPSNRYSDYGLLRTPYEPVLSSSTESRTFFLIQRIVQRVATAIQRCQVGTFSLLINRCQQQTTTAKITTTPTTTTAETTVTAEPTTL